MEDKLSSYTAEIMELFRYGKISSVRINGVLYENYADIPADLEIYSLNINKKYIKLFKDEVFILNNFISNKEMLVKNNKTGRYICLKVTEHARTRLITRYAVLYIKYRDFLNDTVKNIMEDIIEEFLKEFKELNVTDLNTFNSFVSKFVKAHEEELNLIIYNLFKGSSTLKNVSRKYKKREEKHGPTNIFISYPFALIYDINNSLIRTIEIHELSKQDVDTKYVRCGINKNVSNMNYLLRIMKSNTNN